MNDDKKQGNIREAIDELLITGGPLQEALDSFDSKHVTADLAILAAIDVTSDKDAPKELREAMPPGLIMVAMLFSALNIDKEQMMKAICAKHLVLSSLRTGDTDLVNAYAELEYAADKIKAELSAKK